MPPRRSKNPLERILHEVDAGPSRSITTGFPSVDRMLGGGLRRQDLVVLAGDVASGKSSLALAMAVRAAREGVPTLLLSGEMEEQRLLERAVAFESRVSVDEIRQARLDDAARASVGAAVLKLRGTSLAIRPLLGRSFDEIPDALRRVPRPQFVVVDALNHVTPPRDAARSSERVARAVRALKAVALEYDTVVLVTAPTPGLRPGRADMRPVLDDLGAGGAVKQHADVVLAIYREEMYAPGSGVEGAAELLVRKNRNGPAGFVDLYFYSRWLRFEDMLDPEP
jgi:replicative DNA helicase